MSNFICEICGSHETVLELKIEPDREFGEDEPTLAHVCSRCWSKVIALAKLASKELLDRLQALEEWKEEKEADERMAFNVALYSGK